MPTHQDQPTTAKHGRRDLLKYGCTGGAMMAGGAILIGLLALAVDLAFALVQRLVGSPGLAPTRSASGRRRRRPGPTDVDTVPDVAPATSSTR